MPDNTPRYTTERLHYEIAKAREYGRTLAFEEAVEAAEKVAFQYDKGLMHYKDGDPERLRQLGAIQGADAVNQAISALKSKPHS